MSIFSSIKSSKKLLQTTKTRTLILAGMSSDATKLFENERKGFQDALPDVIDSLQYNSKFSEMPETGAWLKKILQYNLPGGKNTRGLTTVVSYKLADGPQRVTEEKIMMARRLGWCVEMFQAYCLVLDDIMDGSTTRRGRPCWYLRPDVGLGCAINDSLIISSALFETLKNNCKNTPNYVKMFHLFNEILWYTTMGQHLDHVTSQKRDFSLFTPQRYFTIIRHKSAYYTYNLPVCLGLLLANTVDDGTYRLVQEICLEIGTLFQIQDDFIDCYGDETKTGKVGTDIQEHKCTWLAIQALQRCSESQRIVFKTCYGSNEPAHIERVKRLYEELRLRDVYKAEEMEMYEGIQNKISKITSRQAAEVLQTALDVTYNRKK